MTVRAGGGTEKFYARLGYVEVGRLPERHPGGPRDEIQMWLGLGR